MTHSSFTHIVEPGLAAQQAWHADGHCCHYDERSNFGYTTGHGVHTLNGILNKQTFPAFALGRATTVKAAAISMMAKPWICIVEILRGSADVCSWALKVSVEHRPYF